MEEKFGTLPLWPLIQVLLEHRCFAVFVCERGATEDIHALLDVLDYLFISKNRCRDGMNEGPRVESLSLNLIGDVIRHELYSASRGKITSEIVSTLLMPRSISSQIILAALRRSVGPYIRHLIESTSQTLVESSGRTGDEHLAVTARRSTRRIVDLLCDSVPGLPSPFRHVCATIFESVERIAPNLGLEAVSRFLFTKFLIPAILNPETVVPSIHASNRELRKIVVKNLHHFLPEHQKSTVSDSVAEAPQLIQQFLFDIIDVFTDEVGALRSDSRYDALDNSYESISSDKQTKFSSLIHVDEATPALARSSSRVVSLAGSLNINEGEFSGSLLRLYTFFSTWFTRYPIERNVPNSHFEWIIRLESLRGEIDEYFAAGNLTKLLYMYGEVFAPYKWIAFRSGRYADSVNRKISYYDVSEQQIRKDFARDCIVLNGVIFGKKAHMDFNVVDISCIDHRLNENGAVLSIADIGDSSFDSSPPSPSSSLTPNPVFSDDSRQARSLDASDSCTEEDFLSGDSVSSSFTRQSQSRPEDSILSGGLLISDDQLLPHSAPVRKLGSFSELDHGDFDERKSFSSSSGSLPTTDSDCAIGSKPYIPVPLIQFSKRFHSMYNPSFDRYSLRLRVEKLFRMLRCGMNSSVCRPSLMVAMSRSSCLRSIPARTLMSVNSLILAGNPPSAEERILSQIRSSSFGSNFPSDNGSDGSTFSVDPLLRAVSQCEDLHLDRMSLIAAEEEFYGVSSVRRIMQDPLVCQLGSPLSKSEDSPYMMFPELDPSFDVGFVEPDLSMSASSIDQGVQEGEEPLQSNDDFAEMDLMRLELIDAIQRDLLIDDRTIAEQMALRALQQFIRTSAGGDAFDAIQYIFSRERLIVTPNPKMLCPIYITTSDGVVRGLCVMFYRLFDPDPPDEDRSVHVEIEVRYEKVLDQDAEVRVICFDRNSSIPSSRLLREIRSSLDLCVSRLGHIQWE